MKKLQRLNRQSVDRSPFVDGHKGGCIFLHMLHRKSLGFVAVDFGRVYFGGVIFGALFGALYWTQICRARAGCLAWSLGAALVSRRAGAGNSLKVSLTGRAWLAGIALRVAGGAIWHHNQFGSTILQEFAIAGNEVAGNCAKN